MGYNAKSNNSEQLDQQLVMGDQRQQENKQQQDEVNWQERKEKNMVNNANDEEANQELSTAINDVKMDIEEAEEEQVMKEADSVLMQPLRDAEEDMKLVMEQMLKEQKYKMSKDALEEMEKEMVDRLEDEVNEEFNGIAEKIAKEKEEEIDVVVIEDRNVYPNPAHIEKDIKKMEKYFIDDMAREIDETAANIKDSIPSKIENITMTVMEEKTGLHIKENYVKDTKKMIQEGKQSKAVNAKAKNEKGTKITRAKEGTAREKKTQTGRTEEGTSTMSANKDDTVKKTETATMGYSKTSKIANGASKASVVDKNVSAKPAAVNAKEVVRVDDTVSDDPTDGSDQKGGDAPKGVNSIESISQVVREEKVSKEQPNEE